MKATLESMKESWKNNQLQPITINNIKDLVGKRIQILNFGYAGQDTADEFVVGEVISQYELASRNVLEIGMTRAEEWEKNLNAKQLQKAKNDLVILAEDGRNTYIFFDSEYNCGGEFHMGDTDRSVYYRLAM